MKLQQLVEARNPSLSYTEKSVKNVLDRVILELSDSESASMTKLLKRYERLDKSTKLLKESRDVINTKIKLIADDLFNAEDEILTRVVKTVSYTMTLSKAVKAEDKEVEHKINYEAAFNELTKLVPELDDKVKEITEKYTSLVQQKDTVPALKVKSNLEEGLFDFFRSIKSFISGIFSWGSDYDRKLKIFAKKYL